MMLCAIVFHGKKNKEIYILSNDTGILHCALYSSQLTLFPTKINDNRFTTSAPLIVLRLPSIMNTYDPVRTDFNTTRPTLDLGPFKLVLVYLNASSKTSSTLNDMEVSIGP